MWYSHFPIFQRPRSISFARRKFFSRRVVWRAQSIHATWARARKTKTQQQDFLVWFGKILGESKFLKCKKKEFKRLSFLFISTLHGVVFMVKDLSATTKALVCKLRQKAQQRIFSKLRAIFVCEDGEEQWKICWENMFLEQWQLPQKLFKLAFMFINN